MKKIVVLLFFLPQMVWAQTEGFSLSEAIICTGEVLFIENLLPDTSTTYNWNFCIDNSELEYDIENLGSLNEVLSTPTFFTVQKDGDQYFAFGTNYSKGLVRLSFGNDLDNIQTADLLGKFGVIPASIEGISINNDNGIWWGFLVAGDVDDPSLIRLRFGESLANTPVVENLGNIGALSWPHDLTIFKEQENWFGYTINRDDDSLTRFSFGASLSNLPTGENLGNVGFFNTPVGFTTHAENGEWYLLVCNTHGHNISKLHFGNALSNDPVYVGSINSFFFDKPRDILLYRNCIGLAGFVLNHESSEATILNFQGEINNTPQSFNLGNIGDFDFPHAFSNIVRVDNDLHFFITSVYNSSLIKVSLSGCQSASPSSSDSYEPPPVIYSMAGNYIIELVVDEGLPTQQNFCKEIEVLPSPDLDLGVDTIICNLDQLILETDYPQTVWQDGSTGFDFTVSQSGTYSVEVVEGMCLSTDTVKVIFEDCISCLIFPNAFTPDGDGTNDVFRPIINCDPGFIDFELSIFNRWGQLVYQSKNIAAGWDGTYKNIRLPAEVFTWFARFKYLDQGKVVEKLIRGDVTLIQ